MMMVKIAARNLFRNTRRSVTTLGTITVGAAAVLVFGAYITYIEYGVQTNAVQRTGHLQVFRNGYFALGTAAPGAWGIDHYSTVLSLMRQGIRKQFLVEGSLLGAIGATVGVVLAQIVAYAVNHAGLTWTPPNAGAPVPLRLYTNGAYALIGLTWIGLLIVSTLAALIPGESCRANAGRGCSSPRVR